MEQDSQGFFENLATKVIDNLQISVVDLHIRFEDHFLGDQQYSFGIVMNSLNASTTNSEWIPKYVDRTQNINNTSLYKMLKIDGFGVYLNPNDNMIVHQQTQNLDNRLQLMNAIKSN